MSRDFSKIRTHYTTHQTLLSVFLYALAYYSPLTRLYVCLGGILFKVHNGGGETGVALVGNHGDGGCGLGYGGAGGDGHGVGAAGEGGPGGHAGGHGHGHGGAGAGVLGGRADK